VTARWVVDAVQPHRDLNITWQPISLLFKNNPAEDSPYRKPVEFTHNLLRVLESVRKSEGDAAVQPLYWEYGRRIHHDGDKAFDPADALASVDLPISLAAAFGDETWDAEIRTRMDAGLALTGNDVGTPIMAFKNADGEKVALFGPVITSVPSPELSLQLWDGFIAVATVPGFWELKRTRTASPQFPDRP
jgi:hypothetical protein